MKIGFFHENKTENAQKYSKLTNIPVDKLLYHKQIYLIGPRIKLIKRSSSEPNNFEMDEIQDLKVEKTDVFLLKIKTKQSTIEVYLYGDSAEKLCNRILDLWNTIH